MPTLLAKLSRYWFSAVCVSVCMFVQTAAQNLMQLYRRSVCCYKCVK